MTSMESQGERVNIEFLIPSRGIIGLRTNMLTASQGEAIIAHRFKEYQPYKGDINRRVNGSLIALESGNAYAYAIDHLQDRGRFFIAPQDQVTVWLRVSMVVFPFPYRLTPQSSG